VVSPTPGSCSSTRSIGEPAPVRVVRGGGAGVSTGGRMSVVGPGVSPAADDVAPPGRGASDKRQGGTQTVELPACHAL